MCAFSTLKSCAACKAIEKLEEKKKFSATESNLALILLADILAGIFGWHLYGQKFHLRK